MRHPPRLRSEWSMHLLLALSLLICASGARADGQGSRQFIMIGGAVYTLNPTQPWASAVVIESGRIAYVGDTPHALGLKGPRAQVVNLRGLMVLPGFHDGHTHLISGGFRLLRCDLTKSFSLDSLYSRVRDCAATAPRSRWLAGHGWPDRFAPALSRTNLDRLVPDRPAVFTSFDDSKIWVNSRALVSTGIRSGSILEGEAAKRVWRSLPLPSKAEHREALRRALQIANSFGITSVFDAAAKPALLDAYRAADRAGELTVRVTAAQVVDRTRGPEQVAEMAARRAATTGPRFHANAAKLFLDEEATLHTAALLEPYADDPRTRGRLLLERIRLNAIVRELDRQGFLVHMHAMGDAAVRAGLDAIAQAEQANNTRDRRHQIAHLGVVDPADIPRFAKFGVAANFQPLWFPADDLTAAATEVALGASRTRWVMPMRSIAAAGARVVAGSDWPSTSMNPLEGMQAAITRQPLDERLPPRQPRERMALTDMIAAYTRNAALAAGEDSIDGSIMRGKAADLIVLDRNLFQTPPQSLHTARVLLTLLEGKVVYHARNFRL